jgi:hypothetical protein
MNDGDRAFADIKILNMEDNNDKKENSYDLNSMAFDCKNAKGNVYKTISYDEKNNKIFDKVYGLPKTVELDFDYSDKSTIGYSIFELICKKSKYTQLTEYKINGSSDWERFYTLSGGDEIYIKKNSTVNLGQIIEIKAGIVLNKPELLSQSNLYGGFEKLKNSPTLEFSVSIQKIDCNKKIYWSYVDQLYDANSELIAYTLYQEHLVPKNKIETGSAFEQIYKSFCNFQ